MKLLSLPWSSVGFSTRISHKQTHTPMSKSTIVERYPVPRWSELHQSTVRQLERRAAALFIQLLIELFIDMQVDPTYSFAAETNASKPKAVAESSLATALSRRLIEPDCPVVELQSYVRPRIPRLHTTDSVSAWEAYATKLRQDILDRIVFRGRAAEWRDAPCSVEWLDTSQGGPGYKIRKLRYAVATRDVDSGTTLHSR